MRRLLCPLWLALCCGGDPAALDVQVVSGGLQVQSSESLSRVDLLDSNGVTVATRRLPAPAAEVHLSAPVEPGSHLTVRAHLAGGGLQEQAVQVPLDLAPLALSVEAPTGQAPVPAVEDIPLAILAGGQAEITLRAEAMVTTDLVLRAGDLTEQRRLSAGERATWRWTVDADLPVTVEAGSWTRSFTIRPSPASSAAWARDLRIQESVFPADALGRADVARPAGRVTLPARWWQRTLQAVGAGTRARDDAAPWGFQAITVANAGASDVSVVVRARITDAGGAPDPAFRPRLRDVDDGTGMVSGLLRVPAGKDGTLVLPIFVDEERLGQGPWVREIQVIPLGADAVVAEHTEPLYVSRGSQVTSLGFAGVLAAGALGAGLLLFRSRRWLSRAPTSELTTVAMFGALDFTISAMVHLVGIAISAVLGPFSPLLVGLIDKTLSYALLATLVTLLPRPGVVGAAVLVAFGMRAMALGGVSPAEILAACAGLWWIESCLWLAGLTRGGGWRQARPGARWARLALGFGSASVLSTATVLLISVVLYRLFFAGWYVALLLALPGLLYSVVATGIAVPFAQSLREVER